MKIDRRVGILEHIRAQRDPIITLRRFGPPPPVTAKPLGPAPVRTRAKRRLLSAFQIYIDSNTDILRIMANDFQVDWCSDIAADGFTKILDAVTGFNGSTLVIDEIATLFTVEQAQLLAAAISKSVTKVAVVISEHKFNNDDNNYQMHVYATLLNLLPRNVNSVFLQLYDGHFFADRIAEIVLPNIAKHVHTLTLDDYLFSSRGWWDKANSKITQGNFFSYIPSWIKKLYINPKADLIEFPCPFRFWDGSNRANNIAFPVFPTSKPARDSRWLYILGLPSFAFEEEREHRFLAGYIRNIFAHLHPWVRELVLGDQKNPIALLPAVQRTEYIKLLVQAALDNHDYTFAALNGYSLAKLPEINFELLIEFLDQYTPLNQLAVGLLLTGEVQCYFDNEKLDADWLEYYIKRYSDGIQCYLHAFKDPKLQDMIRTILSLLPERIKFEISGRNVANDQRFSKFMRYVNNVCHVLDARPVLVTSYEMFKQTQYPLQLDLPKQVVDRPEVLPVFGVASLLYKLF